MPGKTLLSFLERVIACFEKQDIFGLKGAANKAIEQASLENDRRLASLALVSYCLHKMASKQHIVGDDRWREIKHDILFDLKKAGKSAEAGDLEEYDHWLAAVIDSVRQADKELGYYVQDIFEKARVKYASAAYSMGLGLGQAAELTGADKKELLRYIGVTKIADREGVTAGIGERLKRLKGRIGGAVQ
jgi:hypothetical protein